jgi:hypothetical protein
MAYLGKLNQKAESKKPKANYVALGFMLPAQFKLTTYL